MKNDEASKQPQISTRAKLPVIVFDNPKRTAFFAILCVMSPVIKKFWKPPKNCLILKNKYFDKIKDELHYKIRLWNLGSWSNRKNSNLCDPKINMMRKNIKVIKSFASKKYQEIWFRVHKFESIFRDSYLVYIDESTGQDHFYQGRLRFSRHIIQTSIFTGWVFKFHTTAFIPKIIFYIYYRHDSRSKGP